MAHPRCIIRKLPENGRRTSGMVHPDCRVVHMMPHPSPHIWAHPHDQSLQLLYLSTFFFYNFNTILQNQGLRCHLTPPSLRGPPPLTLSCVPPPPPPLVTPAHVGSDVSGSGHQPWCQNLTTGHHMPVSPLPP